jgi:DNA modification methylase
MPGRRVAGAARGAASVSVRLLKGDCRELLPRLPAASVHCVVTSPPYWGLRDYGVAGQLGLEPTPEAYVATMVGVFHEVRRVLRDDGTLWLNMGDSYATGGTTAVNNGDHDGGIWRAPNAADGFRNSGKYQGQPRANTVGGSIKPKDLVGMPWRLAFALQADGWFLRSDIIWAKPNPMPESVTDRPTKAHEYVFLLSKSARYFYDADAVREPFAGVPYKGRDNGAILNGDRADRGRTIGMTTAARNLRSVWTLATEPTPEAHFATFPTALASRCIQAGSSERGCCAACGAPWVRVVERGHDTFSPKSDSDFYGDGRDPGVHRKLGSVYQKRLDAHPPRTTGWQPSCACEAPVVPCIVLDPFAGTGTVGAVAEQLGRHSILIELSSAYVRLADRRTAQLGLFTQGATA